MRGRGRARELAVRDHFRREGYVARRLADGPADVVAMKAGLPTLLVQVKSTSRPYERFPPAERTALIHEAIAAGAEPVLAWWPSGGELELRHASMWPTTYQPSEEESAA